MIRNESGRSMIEMLGVLAIIGVLSIGGLAGYTMAMNRHRANQVLDYVSRAAVIAQTYGDGSQAVNSANCTALLDSEALPTGLSSCTVSKSANTDIVIVTVAYNSNNTRIANAVANRCSKQAHISTDGTTFTFNDSSKSCDATTTTVGG